MKQIKDVLLEQAKRFGVTQEDIENYKKGDKDVILHGADLITEGGFTKVPNFILRHSKLSASAKLIYADITSYAYGNKTNSFPGQSTIADDLGIAIKTVQRGVAELQKHNFILIVRRGQGKTNVYISNVKSVKDSGSNPERTIVPFKRRQ
jgi:hypothetical protein